MSELEWQLITCIVCIAQERICNSHVIGVLVTAAAEQLRSEHTLSIDKLSLWEHP